MVMYMILTKDIILEGDPLLRKKASKIKLPLLNEEKKLIKDILIYIILSQDENKAQEFNLKPAVGLAAPQVAISKRMFGMVVSDMDGKDYIYGVINPIILKKSKEMTYLNDGEGCLSVVRDTNHFITPRHKEIEVSFLNYNIQTDKFERIKTTLKGYPAIVFQHEYDHLDGILFIDKMYEKLDIKPVFEIQEKEA